MGSSCDSCRPTPLGLALAGLCSRWVSVCGLAQHRIGHETPASVTGSRIADHRSPCATLTNERSSR